MALMTGGCWISSFRDSVSDDSVHDWVVDPLPTEPIRGRRLRPAVAFPSEPILRT